MNELNIDFYKQNAIIVAKNLLGKKIERIHKDGTSNLYTITASEAYLGEEDKACHASKGRTARTEVMFQRGGLIYVYLIYGIHWMLNIVTGDLNSPQAVLICGLDNIRGSGRIGKLLKIDKSFYGEDITKSNRIKIYDAPIIKKFDQLPRKGINYAGAEWINKLWRFEANYSNFNT